MTRTTRGFSDPPVLPIQSIKQSQYGAIPIARRSTSFNVGRMLFNTSSPNCADDSSCSDWSLRSVYSLYISLCPTQNAVSAISADSPLALRHSLHTTSSSGFQMVCSEFWKVAPPASSCERRVKIFQQFWKKSAHWIASLTFSAWQQHGMSQPHTRILLI